MRSKDQFIDLLYNYLLEKEKSVLGGFYSPTYKTSYLRLIDDIKEFIQNEIIGDDIERGQAWNKKDQ